VSMLSPVQQSTKIHNVKVWLNEKGYACDYLT